MSEPEAPPPEPAVVPPDSPSPTEAPTPTGAPSRLRAGLRRLLPFGTLAWALTSAFLMKRTPERAWLVAAAVGAGWLFLAAAVVLARRPADAARARLVRYSATVGTQSLMQLTLFFVLPFYWLSAAPLLGHRVFLGLLSILSLLTLWDPLFLSVFRRLWLAVPLKAATSFVGLFAALPFLGLSHAASLWTAAAGAALGVPLVAAATAAPERRRAAARAGLLVGALLPLSVLLGAARWIPPAPLRLTEGGLGTDVDRKARLLVGAADRFERAPEHLYCFTAIYAPTGLHEQVFHAWRRDGEPLFQAALDVGGNRTGAWRTWSYITPRGPGRYTCEVVTSTGQSLGRLEASVGGAPPAR